MEKNLSKILVCLYIIVAILLVNTIVLIVSNGSIDTSSLSDNASNSNGNSESAENTEYDVSMFDEITTDDLEDVANSDTPQVVYIGRSTCGYCVQFLPSLQKAQSEYGYTTKYLDLTKITEDGEKELLTYDNDDKELEENYGATPQVLIFKDGELVDVSIGYLEYDALASFLEENGISK